MDEKKLNRELLKLNQEYLDIRSSKEYRLGEKLYKAKSAIKRGSWKALLEGWKHSAVDKKIASLAGANAGQLTYGSGNDDRKERIIVYTCISANYDQLLEPVYVPDWVDYCVITDAPVDPDSTWKKMDLEEIPFLRSLDATRKARYIKLHPHELFPEYQYSIWVDSNVRVVGDISDYVRCLGRIPIASNWHPLRNCIYKEAEACILKKKDDAAVLKKQVEAYRKEGMPEQFGLIETNMIVRRHHDPECIQIMEAWWKEIQKESKRDQLSLPYVIWRLGYSMNDIGFIGRDIRKDPAVQVLLHTSAYKCSTD